MRPITPMPFDELEYAMVFLARVVVYTREVRPVVFHVRMFGTPAREDKLRPGF